MQARVLAAWIARRPVLRSLGGCYLSRPGPAPSTQAPKPDSACGIRVGSKACLARARAPRLRGLTRLDDSPSWQRLCRQNQCGYALSRFPESFRPFARCRVGRVGFSDRSLEAWLRSFREASCALAPMPDSAGIFVPLPYKDIQLHSKG